MTPFFPNGPRKIKSIDKPQIFTTTMKVNTVRGVI